MALRVVIVTTLLICAFAIELLLRPSDTLRPLFMLSAAAYGTVLLYAVLDRWVKGTPGFILLQPALHGAFINDDYVYILNHPYTNPLNAENFIEILDPFGDAMLYGVNYAPVQLLVHALERLVFGKPPLSHGKTVSRSLQYTSERN